MDTNTHSLMKKYYDRYYPVMSIDILETVICNFTNEVQYSDPVYVLELVDILTNNLQEIDLVRRNY